MEQKQKLTAAQVAELGALGELMAAVPPGMRVFAANEVAAYIQGYSAAMQANAGNHATVTAPASA